MTYELRNGPFTLKVDPESGPVEWSLLSNLAEYVVRLGSWAVTPTGPFLEVSWADPGLLAAAMTARSPESETLAFDEGGNEITFSLGWGDEPPTDLEIVF